MKWAMAVLISSILMLNVKAFFTEAYSEEHKTIMAHMVSQDDLSGEALLISGIVLRRGKNKCVIEIISETHQGYILMVQGGINVKQGDKIEGFLYRDKFAPIRKSGRRLRWKR